MKSILKTVFLIVITGLISSCAEKDYVITISTGYGDMKVILFDETPGHKETFLEMAKSGAYDNTVFHRVMQGFMIQGGDVNRKPGINEPVNTLIPPEYRRNLIHTKGMLAGARTPDNVNPEKKSGTQFYIVQGRKYPKSELQQINEDVYYNLLVSRLNQLFQQGKHRNILDKLMELQKANDNEAVKKTMYESLSVIESEFGKIPRKTYTEQQYAAYETVGGAPHLDWEYTVFGQVVEGLEVIDAIARQPVNGTSRPLEDIYITVTVEELPKKKITELYGFAYPEKK